MKIEKILEKADELFDSGRPEEAGAYLEQCLGNAEKKQDFTVVLPVLNELMGYYRSISEFDRAWKYAGRALEIVLDLNLEETLAGVTTFLNVANIYRASGEPEQAVEIYSKVEAIYKKEGIFQDYRLGSLYNNFAVAYLEAGDREAAVRYSKMAIEELKKIPGSEDEQAAAYSNLAGAILYSEEPDFEEAECCLTHAEDILKGVCEHGPHYCAVIAMQAFIFYLKGEKKRALDLYEKAAKETKKHYGENLDYKRLMYYYRQIREELGE